MIENPPELVGIRLWQLPTHTEAECEAAADLVAVVAVAVASSRFKSRVTSRHGSLFVVENMRGFADAFGLQVPVAFDHKALPIPEPGRRPIPSFHLHPRKYGASPCRRNFAS